MFSDVSFNDRTRAKCLLFCSNKVPGADLTNYRQLPQASSWLQGGLSTQHLATQLVHISDYLIDFMLAVGHMLQFNADLILRAIPGADLTNYCREFPVGLKDGPTHKK
ncbi:hypothetical protein PVK06_012194 [Gossypium arboreum]|uniref:Uncharacterized protein n=1 Tax=Gossypium arboreum TaxID=29729 RepID=A0ABR0QBG0_GOSAR|nr:hypothetical protein PVK06_012194 [Gossypium arboreum]